MATPATRESLIGGYSGDTSVNVDPLQEERDLSGANKKIDALAAVQARELERRQKIEQQSDDMGALVKTGVRNVQHIKSTNDCLCKILVICVLVALAVSIILMFRKPPSLNSIT